MSKKSVKSRPVRTDQASTTIKQNGTAPVLPRSSSAAPVKQDLSARAAARRSTARKMRQQTMMRGIGLLLMLLSAAGLIFLVVQGVQYNQAKPVASNSVSNTGAGTSGLNIQTMPDEGAEHVLPTQRVNYKAYAQNLPPTSGPHYPSTGAWKYYDAPLQAEYFVHNLEHGGIVVLFNCPDGCSTEQKLLHDAYNFLPPSKYGYVKLLVTSYPNLKTKFALLAWDKLAQTDTLDRGMIEQFYNQFFDKGPEDAG